MTQSRYGALFGRKIEKPSTCEPFGIMIDKQLEKPPERKGGPVNANICRSSHTAPVAEPQQKRDSGVSRVIFICGVCMSLPNQFQDWKPEMDLKRGWIDTGVTANASAITFERHRNYPLGLSWSCLGCSCFPAVYVVGI